MLKWIKALDRVLKGEATRPEALRGGRIDLPLGGLSVVILLLGVVYGVCMGVYSIVTRWNTPRLYMGYQQLGASAVKVPMLFFLTLLVTLPSLYVFNALVGSRLSFTAVVRLLVAALGVIMAVLASFGTIVVFFSLSTTSYSFMVLLNVVMFALSGILGLGFLLQTLHRLSLAQAELEEPAPPSPLSEATPAVAGGFGPDVGDVGMVPPRPDLPPVATVPPVQPMPPGAYGYPGAAPPVPPKPLRMPGALERLEGRAAGRNVRTVFRIWVIVFGLVGGQMAWMLRPFIGNPDVPFTFFRARKSNFFEAVYDRIVDLATPNWDHEKGPHHAPGAAPSGQPSNQPSGRSGYGG